MRQTFPENWHEATIVAADRQGCVEVFTFPGLFHMESMESIRYSMWNPWNHCWLRPQPIYCSMDIMDSMWNDHGMVMEWLIPYGIQLYLLKFTNGFRSSASVK